MDHLEISSFFDRLATSPVYWYDDASPVLKQAIAAYLSKKPLSESEILSVKLYLQQFIGVTAWEITDEIINLRTSAEAIATVKDIDNWIDDANLNGIDPL